MAATCAGGWLALAGCAPKLLTLNAALWLARLEGEPDEAIESRLDPLTALATVIAFRDPIEVADLAVDGEDLQKAGIPNGPRMGKVLHALLEKVIDDPALNTHAALLEIIARLSP